MTKRVVIKVGGATLFQPSGFESELQSVLSGFADHQVFLLVGGGDLVEAMRTIHKIYPKLNGEDIHWKCVELLDQTWEIAKELFPTGLSICEPHEFSDFAFRENKPSVYWVRAQSFYSRNNVDSIPIAWRPESSWNTTTDALAWLLAKIVDADQVVLMKQCRCDPHWTIEAAANQGVIDSELARLVALHGTERPRVQLLSDFSNGA